MSAASLPVAQQLRLWTKRHRLWDLRFQRPGPGAFPSYHLLRYLRLQGDARTNCRSQLPSKHLFHLFCSATVETIWHLLVSYFVGSHTECCGWRCASVNNSL